MFIIISEELAKELELTSVGVVTAEKLGQNIDFLIGMNIITSGDFSITNVGDKTTFNLDFHLMY